MEDCNTCPLDCKCGGGKCYNSMCCAPNCAGKTCGSDGCGGTCMDRSLGTYTLQYTQAANPGTGSYEIRPVAELHDYHLAEQRKPAA